MHGATTHPLAPASDPTSEVRQDPASTSVMQQSPSQSPHFHLQLPAAVSTLRLLPGPRCLKISSFRMSPTPLRWDLSEPPRRYSLGTCRPKPTQASSSQHQPHYLSRHVASEVPVQESILVAYHPAPRGPCTKEDPREPARHRRPRNDDCHWGHSPCSLPPSMGVLGAILVTSSTGCQEEITGTHWSHSIHGKQLSVPWYHALLRYQTIRSRSQCLHLRRSHLLQLSPRHLWTRQ